MIKHPKRRMPRREASLPEVPETVPAAPVQTRPPEENLPDDIRKMLEAAYT